MIGGDEQPAGGAGEAGEVAAVGGVSVEYVLERRADEEGVEFRVGHALPESLEAVCDWGIRRLWGGGVGCLQVAGFGLLRVEARGFAGHLWGFRVIGIGKRDSRATM